MKKTNFFRTKSFLLLLAMLMSAWFSTAVFAIGENADIADIHDINCKFDCKHITPTSSSFNAMSIISNYAQIVSEEEFVELTAKRCGISIEEAKELLIKRRSSYTDENNNAKIVSKEEFVELAAKNMGVSIEEAKEILNRTVSLEEAKEALYRAGVFPTDS